MTFWQILLKTQTSTDALLTCDECIAILDYLADEAAQGADLESMRQAVRKHLAHCPDCREQYDEWLRELESPQNSEG